MGNLYIYMGKVTNQDGSHTTNMTNLGNWKYFLYEHVSYQNEGNTYYRGSDLNINKCSLTKYIWLRYKNKDESMSRKLNNFSL